MGWLARLRQRPLPVLSHSSQTRSHLSKNLRDPSSKYDWTLVTGPRADRTGVCVTRPSKISAASSLENCSCFSTFQKRAHVTWASSSQNACMVLAMLPCFVSTHFLKEDKTRKHSASYSRRAIQPEQSESRALHTAAISSSVFGRSVFSGSRLAILAHACTNSSHDTRMVLSRSNTFHQAAKELECTSNIASFNASRRFTSGSLNKYGGGDQRSRNAKSFKVSTFKWPRASMSKSRRAGPL
mmetsp:Transcript_112297/g.317408  ORF Transcript_112297/g.317408 Transcript_112297/m.317408 type:complete len:241 (+) Transcript_112297:72-794(+)